MMLTNLPFPAVTIQGESRDPFYFGDNVMNQLTYDCSTVSDSEISNCLRETAVARDIVHPLADDLVRAMFKQYRSVAVADEEKTTDNTIRLLSCLSIYLSEIGRKLLNPMVEALSEPNDPARDQKVEVYIRRVVQFFKEPISALVSNMSLEIQKYTNEKVGFGMCQSTYFDTHLSHEAKAMALLIIKLFQDRNRITMGNWYDWSESQNLKQSSTAAFKNNFEDLGIEISQAMASLVHDDDLALSNIMAFLNLRDVRFNFPKTEIEKDKTNGFLGAQYQKILQVAKYSMKPLGSNMTEQARVNDMERSLLSINATYGRARPSSFINYAPALLYCSFDNEVDHQVCQTPTATFTGSGIGYTFNTKSFFGVYQKSPSMETFCHEINERTDQEMCSAKSSRDDKKPADIKTNGPKFALRLLLNTPQQDRYEWDLQKLAIHSPFSIADIEWNFIKPTPGTHTIIVATPHVTVADDSLLSKSREVRKCHFQQVDGNPLKLFHNYTRDNCVFECHLERSTKECGCVPWNFPKMHQDDKICSHKEVDCFEQAMKDSKSKEVCPKCIDECYKIVYEYTVYTKPLENIGQKDKSGEIKKSVGMVANKKTDYNFLPLDYALQEMGPRMQVIDSSFFYANKNTALVDVYVGPATAFEIVNSPRVTYMEQVANFGGMAALLTGASFMTVLEFIEWIFKTPVAAVRGRRNRVAIN